MNLLVSRSSIELPSQLELKDTIIIRPEEFDKLNECTNTTLDDYSDVYIESQYIDNENIYNNIMSKLKEHMNLTIHYFMYVEEFQLPILKACTFKEYECDNITTIKNIVLNYNNEIPSYLAENETVVIDDFDELFEYSELDKCTDIYIDIETSKVEYNKIIELIKPYNINCHCCAYIYEYEPESIEFYRPKHCHTYDDDCKIYIKKLDDSERFTIENMNNMTTIPIGFTTIYGNTQDAYNLMANISTQLSNRGWDTKIIEPSSTTYSKDQIDIIFSQIQKFYDELLRRCGILEHSNSFLFEDLPNKPSYKSLFIYKYNELLELLYDANYVIYYKIANMIEHIAMHCQSVGMKLIITTTGVIDTRTISSLQDGSVLFITKNNNTNYLDIYFKDAIMCKPYINEDAIEVFTKLIKDLNSGFGIYVNKQRYHNPTSEQFDIYINMIEEFNIDDIKDLI